jgi:hypothetical protein
MTREKIKNEFKSRITAKLQEGLNNQLKKKKTIFPSTRAKTVIREMIKAI